jgi:lipoprotein-releasing system ATP-binding protein
MSNPALVFDGVQRRYPQAGEDLHVLRGVNLTIQPGEVVALVGPSGSGKSTLLHTAGLLERADDGDVQIAGQNCNKLSDRERTRMRRHEIGFVYQFHHLLPEFDAVENVALPQRIAGVTTKMAKQRATELLTTLGLAERLDHLPSKLSGGEQQRVAIARAVANKPVLLLADEPTGNLDEDTAALVFGELMKLSRETNLAALVATHNLDLAGKMDRILRLEQGVISTS